MKMFILLSGFSVLLVSSGDCSNVSKKKVFRGRLEIAAICSNYTIKVIDGSIDTSLVAANWTDETTGKSYTSVFKPANVCELPDSIKQGSEFYFVIEDKPSKDCIVCMAYYPTPPKKLNIKVVNQ